MPFCNNGTLVKTRGALSTIQPLRCRAWTCQHCGPLRRRRLIAEAIGGSPAIFLTLTLVTRPGDDPARKARELTAALNKLRKRIMRHYRRKRLPWLWVLERHKSGQPHIHVLIRGGFIDWRWLRDQWHDLTGATVIDIRKIADQHRIAGYVAKYLGKEPAKFGTCKRYCKTPDYELRERWKRKPARDPSLEISVYWHITPTIARWFEQRGYMVRETALGVYEAQAP